MKKKVGILFLIGVAFYSCNDIEYSRAAQKDGQRLFASHREFFKSLEFTGVVAEKKYCNECHINKYEIVIGIKGKKPEIIELGSLSYQPFYSFDDKNHLIISVTKQIYNSVDKDSLIEKKMNSDSLIFTGLKCRLISDKKMQWLAETE
jgi:cytochrome c